MGKLSVLLASWRRWCGFADTLAEDHPDRLVSQYELALVHKANGQVKEAVRI